MYSTLAILNMCPTTNISNPPHIEPMPSTDLIAIALACSQTQPESLLASLAATGDLLAHTADLRAAIVPLMRPPAPPMAEAAD